MVTKTIHHSRRGVKPATETRANGPSKRTTELLAKCDTKDRFAEWTQLIQFDKRGLITTSFVGGGHLIVKAKKSEVKEILKAIADLLGCLQEPARTDKGLDAPLADLRTPKPRLLKQLNRGLWQEEAGLT